MCHRFTRPVQSVPAVWHDKSICLTRFITFFVPLSSLSASCRQFPSRQSSWACGACSDVVAVPSIRTAVGALNRMETGEKGITLG